MNDATEAIAPLQSDICNILKHQIGMPSSDATDLSKKLAFWLCALRIVSNWGDITSADMRAARDHAIRMQYNGRNVRELMARFHVSKATVHRVLEGYCGIGGD